MRLNNPATTIALTPTTASRITNQRVRVTLCVHASRKVPVSSSRATNGGPQNIPRIAGSTSAIPPSHE